MKTRKIEISPNHFEEFEVIEFNGKVGDTVWFYDDEGKLIEATVKDVDRDFYYMTVTGRKKLGSVQCVWDEDGMHCGCFLDFDEVLLENPVEKRDDAEENVSVLALDTPFAEWHRCTEESPINVSHGAILIAYYSESEDDWYYWTKSDCPYGWNILCKSEAYWMHIGKPVNK